MRVALTSPGYAPDPGGVETHVTRVAEGLVRLGIEVEVWAQQPGRRSLLREVREGVVVHRFPTSRSPRFPVSRALWQHVQRHASSFDVLHAQSYHVTSALSALRAPAPVSVVLTPHYHGTGHSPVAKLMHPAYRPLGRRLVHRAAAVIAVSAAEQALLVADFAGVGARCQVVHNAADVTALHAATPFAAEVPTVLYVGRLLAYKGVEEVVRSFSALTGPARLVVVGDGPDRDAVAAAVAASPRAADVTLTGRVSDADVASWLRTADVVVSLSRHEAFGLVPLEAVAAGAHVVVSDIPAHRELAGLQGGERLVHVPLDDQAAATQALAQALARPRPGITPVRDWSAVAQEHADLYAALLRSPRP